MANTIQIKRKTTSGAPNVSSLADGELCLVVPDQQVYQRINGSTLLLIKGSNDAGVVVHGSTAGTARPSGYAQITWIGSVDPVNKLTNDIWFETS